EGRARVPFRRLEKVAHGLPEGPDPVQHQLVVLLHGVQRGRQLGGVHRDSPPRRRYSSIERAARRPAAMARITVADPVTMSPAANTPGFEVRSVSASAAM